MKRVGYLMPKIVEVDNLLSAFYGARKGKADKEPVKAYSRRLVENILSLRERLMSGEFRFGKYSYFEIYDPKRRTICAADFEERIVHHAIINVCKPYFERHQIYDSYATRDGKGIYAALDKAASAMRRYGYVAKLDVRKYFDSISHNILKSKLRRLFKDEELLRTLDAIVDSYCVAPDRGVPIGNLTSQYFANFYLSFCDHYAKEVLKVPVYVRYMDDVLVFGRSKQEVCGYVKSMVALLDEEYGLRIKSPQITTCRAGVSFLGYRLNDERVVLNARSKQRFKKKMQDYAKLHTSGVWDDIQYRGHIVPLLAFVQKASTMGLRHYMCEKIHSRCS